MLTISTQRSRPNEQRAEIFIIYVTGLSITSWLFTKERIKLNLPFPYQKHKDKNWNIKIKMKNWGHKVRWHKYQSLLKRNTLRSWTLREPIRRSYGFEDYEQNQWWAKIPLKKQILIVASDKAFKQCHNSTTFLPCLFSLVSRPEQKI